MECKKIYIRKNIKLNPSEIPSNKIKIPSPALNTIQKINLIKQNNLYFSNLTKESKITESPTLAETIKILNPKIRKRCLSNGGNKRKKKTNMKRNISLGNFNNSKISQNNSTFSTSNFNDSKSKNENNDLMNVEWIILFILNKYKNKRKCNEDCYKWFKCFVSGKLFNLNYVDSQDTKILCKNLISLMMFGILINYYFSFQKNSDDFNYNLLTDIIIYVHKMYILLCEYYIQITGKNDDENIKIRNQSKKLFTNIEIMQINDIINEMRYLCNYITNSINQILLRNKLQTQQLSNLFKQIKTIPLIEIYNYFLSITPLEKSMIKSISHSNLHNLSNPKISIPYLKYISNKKYTLILDLDETLIHFIPQSIENKGIIQYRPGLYQFLDNLFPYFELILWTGATRQYADPIINSIEKYKKYFSFRLFREYSTFTDGIYIKNLNNLGRDLSKVIIIDDKSCSFSAQKENGILIKPFFGELNQNDYELIELIPILFSIIKECSDDVRIGIRKYKYEILNKISPKVLKIPNRIPNIFIEVNQ